MTKSQPAHQSIRAAMTGLLADLTADEKDLLRFVMTQERPHVAAKQAPKSEIETAIVRKAKSLIRPAGHKEGE
jgi:hypothetical protein